MIEEIERAVTDVANGPQGFGAVVIVIEKRRPKRLRKEFDQMLTYEVVDERPNGTEKPF